MKLADGVLGLAATDLANHIACGHLTTLSLKVVRGELATFTNFDPFLKILAERGREHEDAYGAHLQGQGLSWGSAAAADSPLDLMANGIEVITQARFERGAWRGRADFLVRVERPSKLWPWSYEVVDTKLASETRAGAVLQLCVYSDLLAEVQGLAPDEMHIVKPGPGFPRESFRFDEYAAIYRAIKSDLEQRIETTVSTYPEPVPHCDSCNWRSRCDDERRADDHLSLVANLGRLQRRELVDLGIKTLTALAKAPVPWPHKPERGQRTTYERLAHQARLQLAARSLEVPPFELLPLEPERGLARLPVPTPGDVFLDLEGDPFVDDAGREYLFGWTLPDGGYEAVWALDDARERAGFEKLIDTLMSRWAAEPGMHIYHFAPYETTALKRLAGRYATRAEELDRLLRGRRFVDLHSVTRQALRAGVESYSIKCLEPMVGYTREIDLDRAGASHRALKLALQRGLASAIEPTWAADVELYNRDDCVAARVLRDWLEARRAEVIAGGASIVRPPLHDGSPDPEGAETRSEAAKVAARLLADLPADRSARTSEQQARWLLGHLMEWYSREHKVAWWDFFRLAELGDEERLDESRAIAGLEHVETIPDKKIPIDRFRFPDQEVLLRSGDEVHVNAELALGTIVSIDLSARTVDVKKTGKTIDIRPTSLFAKTIVRPRPKDEALLRLGTQIADQGWPPTTEPSIARDLMLKAPPRQLGDPGASLRRPDEAVDACAVRLALALHGAVLPIQGPPGSGKTETAAKMICALAGAGRRVGVTATSHAVIANLVARAVELAKGGPPLRAMLRADVPTEAQHAGIEYASNASVAEKKIGELDVLGATAWQWARAGMANSVDVLIIDEAGQMSLADAIAVSGSARSLVLVGDPQQLEQPMQGTHPDDVAVSVLEHMLDGAQTIAPDRGLFLDETHRLHPSICTFTSEQFYERRLRPGADVGKQKIRTKAFTVPGLYWLPITHHGNQIRCAEEAAAVAELVEQCLAAGTGWTRSDGEHRKLNPTDVLIVAPYNAHVEEIRNALDARSLGQVRVGTVDKFQGQQAAIAIYSMATSVPEDAPHGLSFLYDRHRLNVATSRARCASILVCSPALLRPDCRTPRHLHLASTIARYVELCARLGPGDVSLPGSGAPPAPAEDPLVEQAVRGSSMKFKRRVLSALSKPELFDLGGQFELEVTSRMNMEQLTDALLRSKKATLDKIVSASLPQATLKSMCKACGLSDEGRGKQPLIDRILAAANGEGSEVTSISQTPLGIAEADAAAIAAARASVAPAPRAPRASRAGEGAVDADGAAVLSYRFDDRRKNNPEVGMVNPDTDPVQPKTRWAYDPHVDPTLQFDITRAGIERVIDDALASGDVTAMQEALIQLRRQAQPYLAWTGKAERTSFDIDTVSLHVHERIDPASILSAVRKGWKKAKPQAPAAPSKHHQLGLFSAAFENLPLRDAIDFYKHDKGWSNRLIAGDSLLVMNSLLQKESMAGQVDMVYLDPPYGIRYGSNFQPFVNKRDVVDQKDEDLTQEPEMIKAFRDTWELGIHSYLTYLRDRLLLARSLLRRSGSCFVQISDENLHHVRELMDELFDAKNFIALITVQKTTSSTNPHLSGVADYLLWYAKDKTVAKYRDLYKVKEVGGDGAEHYNLAELPSGKRIAASQVDEATEAEARWLTADQMQSASVGREKGEGAACWFEVKHQGRSYLPNEKNRWKTNEDGVRRLCRSNRVVGQDTALRYARYLDDFVVYPLHNIWTDFGGAPDKTYVVQTNPRIIERCILMTTDPGDLVIDPTCGSGTTSFAAEKLGRRWITCDTSRVAITLAKQRLMTASYDYYELKYPHEGLKGGFIYKTAPHIMLKDIANNPDVDEIWEEAHPKVIAALHELNKALTKEPPAPFTITEGGREGEVIDFKKKSAAFEEWELPFEWPFPWPATARASFDAFHTERLSMQARMNASNAAHAEQEVLYDQPRVAKDRLRITGPFTVEAVPFPTVFALEAGGPTADADVTIARSGESSRQHQWRDELLKTGIRGKGGQMLMLASLEALPELRYVHGTGSLAESGDRVVVSFGPEHGALEQRQVEMAMREAGDLFPRPKMIVFCAFAFDPEAAKDIDQTKGIVALKAQMNTDLLTDDLKRARSSNQSFWLMGQPDVEIRSRKDGLYEVEVQGFDYFDTTKGELVSGGKSKIAMWSLDTDYDERSLLPRQVFFPMAGAKDGWHRLRKDLRAELDEGRLAGFHGTVSLPFESGENRKVAVKVVDDRGIESLKILQLD